MGPGPYIRFFYLPSPTDAASRPWSMKLQLAPAQPQRPGPRPDLLSPHYTGRRTYCARNLFVDLAGDGTWRGPGLGTGGRGEAGLCALGGDCRGFWTDRKLLGAGCHVFFFGSFIDEWRSGWAIKLIVWMVDPRLPRTF